MSRGIWCPVGEGDVRRGRLVHSLVSSGLLVLLSLPFFVSLSAVMMRPGTISLEAAQGLIDSLSPWLGASLIASWIGFLMMVKRTRDRIRPPDRSHLDYAGRADSVSMLPFREREFSGRHGQGSRATRGHGT